MNLRAPALLLALAIPGLASTASSAECDLDLASGKSNEIFVSVATRDQREWYDRSKDLDVTICNVLPGEDYQIGKVMSRSDRTIDVEDVLQLPSVTPKSRAAAAPCDVLAAAIRDLAGTTKEADVPARRRALRAALDAGSACPKASAAETLIAGTTRTVNVPIRDEAVTTVTVQRTVGSETVTWTLVIRTTPRGKWLIHFAAGFSPDTERQYFGRTETAGQPQKLRSEAKDDLSFVPAVVFSRKNGRAEGRTFTFGPAAGLGFEDERPAVFGGLHWTYRDNLALFVGPIFREEERLRAQYELGQDLPADLTPDQLVEKRYDVGAWIGIGLRLDKNPFSKNSEDDATPGTQHETNVVDDGSDSEEANSEAEELAVAPTPPSPDTDDPSPGAPSNARVASRSSRDTPPADAQHDSSVIDGSTRSIAQLVGSPTSADSPLLDSRRRLFRLLVDEGCEIVDVAGIPLGKGPEGLARVLARALGIAAGTAAGVDGNIDVSVGDDPSLMSSTATLASANATSGRPAGSASVDLVWSRASGTWKVVRATILG
jgi:hypothetical protein